jgi:hypothetical protein
MSETLVIEPAKIIAGNTVIWHKYVEGYSPETYTLTYALVKTGTLISISGAVVVNGGDGGWLVTLPAATTAAYAAGEYRWQAYLTASGVRYDAGAGAITIVANFALATGGMDARPDAKQILDAIEAMIKGKALQGDQAAYAIGDRSISRMGPEELTKWREFYRRECARLDKADRLAAGLGSGSKIRVRF